MVGVPEARVKALKDYIRPTNQKELRAFLGTAGYYRKFIPEFSQWAGPLFDAFKKGVPVLFHGINVCVHHIISVLCHEHTLTLPRCKDKLELHTDASTMDIEAMTTSTGGGHKPEGRAPSLGGGDVLGSPRHCPRTIKMAVRPEHLA